MTISTTAPPSATFTTDAFISYSREDVDFAARLARALEAQACPPEPRTRRRRLRIFRDQRDFTGVEYYRSVEKHLGHARKLLVICSPAARRSEYVNDEIRRFVALRGAAHIVPVLWRGDPIGQPQDGAAFPQALCEALAPLPLAVDFRQLDLKRQRPDSSAFSDAWYGLLANLFDLERRDVEQRDRNLKRRNLRIVSALALLIIGLLAMALVVTVEARNTAIHERDVAEQRRKQALSRQLVAKSLLIEGKDLAGSVRLAIEATRLVPDLSARTNLHELLQRNPSFVGLVTEHPAKVLAVQQVGGGSTVMSVASDGTVASGARPSATSLRKLPVDKAGAAAISPDGSLVAFGVGSAVQLWNVATGSLHSTMGGHSAQIAALAFSPDGRRVASGSWDSTARVWDVREGRLLLGPLEGHTEGSDPMARGVLGIAFNGSGTMLATTGGDNIVFVWDLTGGIRIAGPLKGHGIAYMQLFPGVRAVAFSPDGKRLATGGDDRDIRLWDCISGTSIGLPLSGHQGAIHAVRFLDTGHHLVSGDELGELRLWNLEEGRRSTLLKGLSGDITSLAAYAAGSFLSGDENGRVVEWTSSGARDRMAYALAHQLPGALPHYVAATGRKQWPAFIRRVVVSQSGELIAAGSDDGAVVVWQRSSKRELDRFSCAPGAIYDLRFSKDDSLLACSGFGLDVVVKNLKTKNETKFRAKKATTLAFDSRATRLVAGFANGSVQYWNISDPNAEVRALSSGDKPVVLLRLLERDSQLLVADIHGRIQLFDLASGKLLREGSIPNDGMQRFGVAEDAALVAFANERVVHVWDLGAWREAATWPIALKNKGPGRPRLALSEGLLAVADNSDVILIDTKQQKQTWPTLHLGSTIDDLAFGPRGGTLAVSAGSGTVNSWELDWSSWERVACQVVGRPLSRAEWQENLEGEFYRPACAPRAEDQGLRLHPREPAPLRRLSLKAAGELPAEGSR